MEADNSMGRALLDLVNSVPHMSKEEFDAMLNSNMQVGVGARHDMTIR